MSTSMGGSSTKLLCSLSQYGFYTDSTEDSSSILPEDSSKSSEANKASNVPSEANKVNSKPQEASKASKTSEVLPNLRQAVDKVREVTPVPQDPKKSAEGAVHEGGSKVLVHPINVGQGDAILLEIQHQQGVSEKHLIDGGRGQRTVNTQFYYNLKRTLQENGCLTTTLPNNTTVELDAIIITHPNVDHYGGINRLLASSTMKCPIITTLASCVSVCTEGKSELRQGEIFVSNGTAQIRHWFPFTGEGENGRKHTYIETLPRGSSPEIVQNKVLKFDSKELNATSILTTVKLPNSKYDYDVVMTGDSYCNMISDKLALRGKSVGVFQVPHHGSRYNHSRHSTRATLEREFADFYSSFRADIYLVSHGDHGSYNHPHSEVITGIARAAVEKKRHCKIVVTATWFHDSRIDDEIVPKWSDYVKIYHFKNDIPYVTLDPSNSAVPEGLQQYTKKVQAPKIQESESYGEAAKKEKINRDGNSFFNAVSRALTLTSTPTSPYQLREKLVQHLMEHQYLYQSQSGAATAEKYQELVGNYLLDGHFSPEIGHLLPEAMAKTLGIQIQILSINSEQVKTYGYPRAQTIQLKYDGSYYDYTPSVTTPAVAKDAKEYTPIRSRLPSVIPTQEPVGARSLLFSNDSDTTRTKTSSLNKECNTCKKPVSPSDYLYGCSNRKCPIKVHTHCETEARKSDRFVRNYSKCRYCRTCKECTVVMGTVHVSCDLCGGAGHTACVRSTPGQMRDNYNCRVCREKTEQCHNFTPLATKSSANTNAQEQNPITNMLPVRAPTLEPVGTRRLLFPDDSATTRKKTSPLNKECNTCKKPVSASDYLYGCSNRKCPIKVHAHCETEARKSDRFVRNFSKCRYCRTCKECNDVMGTVHVSCDLCGGAGHTACVRSTPGQTRDNYNCRVCRKIVG